MIDIGKIRKDIINYGVVKVYEWTAHIEGEELDDFDEDAIILESQKQDIIANKYDILKLNLEIVIEEAGTFVIRNEFFKVLDSNQESNADQVVYCSGITDDGELTRIILLKSENIISMEIDDFKLGNQFNLLYFSESGTILVGRDGFSQTQKGMIFYAGKPESDSPIMGSAIPLYNNNTMLLCDNENGSLAIETVTENGITTITEYNEGMSYYRIMIVEIPIQLPF